jgi:superfamily II DNA or RNA helicase
MKKPKLKPHQKKGVKWLDRMNGRGLLGDDMGLGKCNSVRSLIRTPYGWTKMGDLHVGDFVIGSQGQPVPVTAVHPQGMKEMFRVTFTDGTSVECCDEHLWCVTTPTRTTKGQGFQVKTLGEMMDSGLTYADNPSRNKYRIPRLKPVQGGTSEEPPISPYLLGVLIAEGALVNSGVQFTLNKFDCDEILGQLKSEHPWEYRESKGHGCQRVRIIGDYFTKAQIEEYELDVYSRERFIPQEYLFCDTSVRVELLRGLMDCDGIINWNRVSYSTHSKKLAEDVCELVRSLGGVAKVTGPYEDEYRVNVRMFDFNPFRLKRKARQWSPPTDEGFGLYIQDVEPLGKMEAQCITVDSPDHLYVASGYKLTHNSVQSLYWSLSRKKTPILIICPASLKSNWENECLKHFGMQPVIIEGRTPPRGWPGANRGEKIYIINYDILKEWGPLLLSIGPRVVIIDEAHKLGNKDNHAFAYVDMLTEDVPHIIPMTGTPLNNRPKELWPLLHLLDPQEFPYFDDFGHEFCHPKREPWGWTYKGARNLDKLHKVLKKYMLRRLKKHETDLGEQKRIIIPMEIEDREQYNDAEDDLIEWIREHHGTKRARKAESCERMVRWNYVRQLASELKMKSVEDWLSRFLKKTDQKMVVFGVHKKIIREGLYKKFRKCSVIIDGTSTPLEKRTAEERFQNDPRIRLAFGNVKSAGVGLNLTAAKYSAVVEMPWTPGDLNQLLARTHRIGQEEETKAFFLIAKDTIEVEMADILDNKQDIFNQVVEGTENHNEYSIVDSLEEALLL